MQQLRYWTTVTNWSPETISKECINVHWSAAGMLWAVKRTWDLPYIGKALRSHNMLVSYLIYTYFARLLTSLRGSLPHCTWSNLHIRLWANAQKYNQSTFEHFMGFRLKVSLFWLNLQFIFSFKYFFQNNSFLDLLHFICTTKVKLI